jgi:hypothetical protein
MVASARDGVDWVNRSFVRRLPGAQIMGKFTMNKLFALLTAGAALCAVTAPASAYTLDITTSYGFGYGGPVATFLGGGSPSPDTGFITYTNSGSDTFVGDVGYTAVSNFGGDLSFLATGVTIAAGSSVYVAIGSESSNVGGFNGAYMTIQPGINITLNGLFGATAASLSVLDSDVHSGVFATNPYGVTLDNYVLQGGDPYGRDTGDGFEVNQAFGHYTFASGTVPEPAAWALMLVGFGAVGVAVRRSKRPVSVVA